jgi:hypothetical protein
MKSSTKILIGVGAVALGGIAYYFYRVNKATEDRGFVPDILTDSTAPGDHFRQFMIPPRTTVSASSATWRPSLPNAVAL